MMGIVGWIALMMFLFIIRSALAILGVWEWGE